MDGRFLEEYLISLGFQVDQPGLANFKGTLERVNKEVESHTEGIAKMFSSAAGIIIGTYAAIGTAAIGLADHVAQSELGFQLFALRMHMSTDAAKKLKIATDALGHSLDEISWNPELRARYFQLVSDQSRMQAGLGPDYYQTMRAIRDIRFEFTRMQVESQYLLMAVVKNIGKAFGLDEGGLLRRLRDFNQWIITNLPDIANKISQVLVPVLRDAKEIGLDLWSGLKRLTTEFVNLIGEMTGDKSLQGELTFKKLATAIEDVDTAIMKAVRDVVGFFKLIDQLGDAAWDFQHGHWAEGTKKARAAWDQFQGGTGKDLAGQGQSMMMSGDKEDLPAIQQGWQWMTGHLDWRNMMASRSQIIKMVVDAANKYNIPPELALAMAKQESNFNESARSSKGAIGVMQLMPGTARDMGVNPYMASENIAGGMQYLAKLFREFGDWGKAVAAYNWGAEHIRRGESLPAETRAYLNSVEGGAARLDVGGIQIYINNPNATPEQIAAIVTRVLDRKLGTQRKTNIAQVAGSH